MREGRREYKSRRKEEAGKEDWRENEQYYRERKRSGRRIRKG